MNLAVCANLPKTPENGVWYRLVQLRYLNSALSSAHTKLAPSRFNAGSGAASARYATLYFADDPLVAQFEAGAILGSPLPGAHLPHPRLAFVTLNVQIVLHEVFDLTDVPGAQTPLGTTVQELTGDWRGYTLRNAFTPIQTPTGLAPTQELGSALFQTGVEGFRSVSARVPYNKTLTVFPDNLLRDSSLTFSDSGGAVVHRIP